MRLAVFTSIDDKTWRQADGSGNHPAAQDISRGLALPRGKVRWGQILSHCDRRLLEGRQLRPQDVRFQEPVLGPKRGRVVQ